MTKNSASADNGVSPSMTRRAAIGIGLATATLIAGGGAVKALAGSEDVVSLPAVNGDEAFAQRCIRCFRCISICPQGSLVPATLNDGLLVARTPKFDFHKGYCDFCNKCIEICPTNAILPVDPLNPATGRIGYAVVQEDRCIAYYQGCAVCKDACQYDAISLDDFGKPVVNKDHCNGCGVCENACPTLIYRAFAGGTRRGIVIVKNAVQEEHLRQEWDSE